MNQDKPKILVILGPTAVGKSRLALQVAEGVSGEIVGADSLQVYKHFDIGTAKPSEEELNKIPHHLIDIVHPEEHFNAGLYRKSAKAVVQKLHTNSTPILLVGGTYLYVRALLSGLIGGISSDEEIRSELRGLRLTFGRRFVYEKLRSVDPESASRIHPNDYVRVERALEVYRLTGEKMSELQDDHGFEEDDYRTLKIGIFEEREALRSGIDQRVDRMLKQGLVDEVRELREMGFVDEKPMQSIGYRQISSYLDGEISFERAVQLIKRDTKRFAKRQMTWLRKDDEIKWYHLPEEHGEIIDQALRFFDRKDK